MKKKLFSIVGAVLTMVAVLTFVYVKNERNKDLLFVANIEALADVELSICIAGGEGASSCEIGGGLDVVGYGVSVACSVTCDNGYYACCGLGCKCIKNNS